VNTPSATVKRDGTPARSAARSSQEGPIGRRALRSVAGTEGTARYALAEGGLGLPREQPSDDGVQHLFVCLASGRIAVLPDPRVNGGRQRPPD
jgi:hypothetical protein